MDFPFKKNKHCKTRSELESNWFCKNNQLLSKLVSELNRTINLVSVWSGLYATLIVLVFVLVFSLILPADTPTLSIPIQCTFFGSYASHSRLWPCINKPPTPKTWNHRHSSTEKTKNKHSHTKREKKKKTMEARNNGPSERTSNGVIDGPTNPMVTPLLNDLYQFTMAYAYWKAGKHQERAVLVFVLCDFDYDCCLMFSFNWIASCWIFFFLWF